MPTVYVTYRDPHTASPVTVAVETALSFRVFRAAALVEGVLLPGERTAVLPAALLLVSLDPPPVSDAGHHSVVRVGGHVLRPTLTVETAPGVDVMTAGEVARTYTVAEVANEPEPPAAAPAGGGAAATRSSRERRRR